MQNTPIPDSYWLVPGKLLAGEYPGAQAEAEARMKLRAFLDAGVTCFLDLTEEDEGLRPYSPLLREGRENHTGGYSSTIGDSRPRGSVG